MTDTNPPSVDRRKVLQRVEGDLQLLIAIVEAFLSRLPESLQKIEAAVRSGDASALFQSAHALKGSVANFSTGSVYHIASRLENLAHSGSLDDAEAVLSPLEEAAAELEIALRMLADDARSGHVLEDV